MGRHLAALVVVALVAGSARGQAGGNAAYMQGGAQSRAVQAERARRSISATEMPPARSTYVEASVLMNTKADEYVVVFGVLEEGVTVAECQAKMAATLASFTASAKGLGVTDRDLFVDFVAQTKTYAFEVSESLAKEKLAGFELKKNVIIHFRDYAVLDKLVAAAAESRIYDLVKVDYVLKETRAIDDRMAAEAARIIKSKAAAYQQLMGLRLGPPAQVLANRRGIFYPSDLYESYRAAETESVSTGFDRGRYVVQGARKSQTFFFNGLTADGYDTVINPVVIDPVIQCTLYVKVRCDAVGPVAPAKRPRRS